MKSGIKMVTGTMRIMNSDEVMAPAGELGTFLRGKWENIRVTGVSPDEQTPLCVRKSLVGLVVPTIFTKEKFESQGGRGLPIPPGSRLAYAPDVIEVLIAAGKREEAEQLRMVVPNPLDMYVFENGIYELASDGR